MWASAVERTERPSKMPAFAALPTMTSGHRQPVPAGLGLVALPDPGSRL